MREHKDGLLLPGIIWIQELNACKRCHIAMISNCFSKMAMSLTTLADFECVLPLSAGDDYSSYFLLLRRMQCVMV